MATRKNTLDHLDRLAQKALNDLYKQSPSNPREAGRQSLHSWVWVGKQVGFNFGYVYQIAQGNKKASNRLLIKLGISPRTVMVNACKTCGNAHVIKRPRHPKTFEQNASDYADWLKVNAGKLAEWVGEYQSRTETP